MEESPAVYLGTLDWTLSQAIYSGNSSGGHGQGRTKDGTSPFLLAFVLWTQRRGEPGGGLSSPRRDHFQVQMREDEVVSVSSKSKTQQSHLLHKLPFGVSGVFHQPHTGNTDG